jgi:hypothetical protein
MTRLTIAMFCLVLLVGATAAHDEYRIIGTVTKVTPTVLEVRQTKDKQLISMKMDKQTIVTRDKKTVDRAQLKTGLSVVVDALGDTIKDLLVLEVRLVPAPAKK